MYSTFEKNSSLTDNTLTLYLTNIGKHKTLSLEEEAKITRRIRKGDRSSLEKLVKSNLRFVVLVCRNYRNQGMPLTDLINEGNIGLIRAAKRFDEKKNYKFISYAVWWIRQAILQALAEHSRIVKLPLNRVNTIYKIGKIKNNLVQKYGRYPNSEEIAKALKINLKEVLEAIRINNPHVSLDAPLNNENDEESRLIDILYDENQETPDTKALKHIRCNEIEDILSKLSKREKEVIKLFFGIGEETTHTLEEIGQRLNLTRERIRQIKDKALRRLKSPLSHLCSSLV